MDSEVFLLLCLFVSQSFALQFEVADRDEITTQDITGNRYYISMHEEIAAPFALGTFDAGII